MISKIDITAYFLVEICNEILSVINHRNGTDNISDLVRECIANNKEQVNLEGFWLNEPANCFPETFWVEFYFKKENDSYRYGLISQRAHGFGNVENVHKNINE